LIQKPCETNGCAGASQLAVRRWQPCRCSRACTHNAFGIGVGIVAGIERFVEWRWGGSFDKREWLAREVVDEWNALARDGVLHSGKITGPLRVAGNGGALRHALYVAVAFKEAEDEILVPAKGRAERRPELVLLQRFDGSGDEVSGIQFVAAQK